MLQSNHLLALPFFLLQIFCNAESWAQFPLPMHSGDSVKGDPFPYETSVADFYPVLFKSSSGELFIVVEDHESNGSHSFCFSDFDWTSCFGSAGLRSLFSWDQEQLYLNRDREQGLFPYKISDYETGRSCLRCLGSRSHLLCNTTSETQRMPRVVEQALQELTKLVSAGLFVCAQSSASIPSLQKSFTPSSLRRLPAQAFALVDEEDTLHSMSPASSTNVDVHHDHLEGTNQLTQRPDVFAVGPIVVVYSLILFWAVVFYVVTAMEEPSETKTR